jgi:prepilin-type N-terminal cleavage/methylation domain-containing protein
MAGTAMTPAAVAGRGVRRARGRAGFTLIELLVAAGVFVVAAGVAIPMLSRALEQYRLGMAARDIERELQTARANAVTTNRPIRVRFNCPAVGQYRRVEVIGDPWQADPADIPSTRCSTTSYPYPVADQDPTTRPNHDGPLRRLPTGVAMGATWSMEFWPDGTARTASGDGTGTWAVIPAGGAAVSVTNGTLSRAIAVNSMGRVQLLR